MISLLINLDTRPGFMEEQTTINDGMMDGARSLDFLTEGVRNKIKFLEGHEIEVIVYIDVHENIPENVMNQLLEMHRNQEIHNLVLRRHTEKYYGEFFPYWNDINYIQTFVLARGKYIMHFDGDVAVFGNDSNIVEEWKKSLDDDKYRYISYPCHFSPNPDGDPGWNYNWASTRFFFCKRNIFDYEKVFKCLQDADNFYSQLDFTPYRKCPWTEHILGAFEPRDKVYYPPYQHDKLMMWTWSNYHSGTYQKLASVNYDQVQKFVALSGGISYPMDLRGARLR